MHLLVSGNRRNRRNDRLSQEFETLREENERLRQENAELRSRVEHTERVAAERQATLETLLESLEKLREQYAPLRKAFFSPRRERFVPSPDQMVLFDPLPVDGNEEAASEADGGEEPARRKRRRPRRKRFQFPQFLEVKRIEYRLSPEDLQCPCGCGERVVISEEVTRQLEFVQASAYVVEHVRFTYGCRASHDGGLITTSDRPPLINEKGIFGPSTIAYLAESKFERHLPLYRLQEELRSATTLWFSRSVLSGALLRSAERLLPLRDLIQRMILRSFFIRADETTGRVLRPGTGKTGLVYLWAYVGDEDYPYQLFDYRLDRSRDGPSTILGEFEGGLLTDGYGVYASLVAESNGRLLDLGCWAHARRKFDESCVVTSHPLAHEALAWIGQLYDIEDRLADVTVEARLDVRRRESVPILERLRQRLLEAQPGVRPSSKLAEAIGYLVNRWEAMTRFASDGRYTIDNNATEGNLRPSVIGRKNYLFFGSDDGGRAACTWYTLVQSARYNHVHVLPYLNDVLVRLPAIVPEYLRVGDAPTPFDALSTEQREALAELLPDRWLAKHPEHRAEDRQRELEEANQRRRQRRAQRRRAVKA